jgi:hypothetical protein
MRRHYWCAARRGATPPATDGLYEGCRAPPRASLDRYVAAQADSARASCHTEADSGRYYLCRGRRRLASRSSAAVPGRRGKSGTACNCRRRESGGYVPKSRDIRGIGMSFTITPEACSPMNKGPPAFSAERSVKPSAQPTLVRTQHPPPEFSHTYLRILRRRICALSGKAAVLQTVVFRPRGRVTVRFAGNPPDRPVQKVRSLDGRFLWTASIGERSGIRGIYAGLIMSRHGVADLLDGGKAHDGMVAVAPAEVSGIQPARDIRRR